MSGGLGSRTTEPFDFSVSAVRELLRERDDAVAGRVRAEKALRQAYEEIWDICEAEGHPGMERDEFVNERMEAVVSPEPEVSGGLGSRTTARKPTKEELADMLREFPTWGHAAVAYRDERDEARKVLLDVEGSLLAYWTDLPEAEVERLRVKIRECLGGAV